MSILLIVIGLILVILGIIGCVLPAIPGPPLSYVALILLQLAKHGAAFTTNELIFWAVVTVIVTVLDYVIPVAGARKYGATKSGVWGSVIGIIIGIIFFPPFGMLVGAFLGAVAGEIFIGKKSPDALKAGWGVFIGTMFGVAIKLAASGVMGFYFIKQMF